MTQLRRSLSRSPSKGPAFRLITSKSTSPSPSSPLSPSLLSPSTRSASASLVPQTNVTTGSPLAVPFPPSAKKTRALPRRLSPMRASLRSSSSQRSPAKRVLSDSTDGGNASPPSPSGFGFGIENNTTQSMSPANQEAAERKVTGLGIAPPEFSYALHPALARLEKDTLASPGGFAAKSSSLKRSDGIMNLDQASLGSPSAKRRSLHGGIFNPDFDIFDHEAATLGQLELRRVDDSMNIDTTAAMDFPNVFSPMPKRTSSLRKTTLQQRHEKPTFARSKPNTDLALEISAHGHAAPKSRIRMSLENFLPSMARDSPFCSQGSLPNASVHPISQTNGQQGLGQQPPPQRHPLSRTITQSSSSSSMAEDSPTHVPVRLPETRRPTVDFSKSLPVGATRPLGRDLVSRETSSHTSSTESSFATPVNYKLAKPLPAAFMSTGLISKRNKNIDAIQPGLRETKAQMPDTPCKRSNNVPPAAVVPLPESAVEKARHVRHSFGTPSTPFSAHAVRPVPGAFGRGVSIFGSSFAGGNHIRRGSFVSLDGEENSQSPSGKGDSQSSTDLDMPPTPTRQAAVPSNVQQTRASDAGGMVLRQPTATRSFRAVGTQSSRPGQTSSPLHEQFERTSPHTPHSNIFPPDPSSLSISVYDFGNGKEVSKNLATSSTMLPPATPTGSREYSPLFGGRRPSIALVHGFPPAEVDPVLTSRFDKVEPVGTGEFSKVYRVTQKSEVKAVNGYFSLPVTRSPPKTPLPDRVWAVKKSRNAYIGNKDRERKLQEVSVLKALGRSDHVVQLFDSWEENNHLYIQTEFCEEGSLDVFLQQVGQKARLDDFRIWKIMLELSLGLKHIHGSGFMHLDLKPANVLITFEGVLKIGDFGMATSWPAQLGIDGEGDREYIGPEILKGQYDKPADVFALGLIMLEIAGNVMLPDNGVSWQRLRTGDMSDVPSLTWSSEASNIFRDSSGKPLSYEDSAEDFYGSDSGGDDFGSPNFLRRRRREQQRENRSHPLRSGELAEPPSFMVDPNDQEALEKVVRWMISPQPEDRPVVDQILGTAGVQWAETRRRAGATIYEGNWGPADDVLADDAEMIDV
ncbi:MAG: kinase [Lasallia pustulata]|uniref:Kinase n=1 Tax=Lasallia pustulata TaxID=136370 RepID=A0A5M8PX54_9LECA|nr:MAG: kinase [Lasallia pustulata]